MSVPDLSHIVDAIYAEERFDLSTGVGCGTFVEAVAPALAAADRRFGHLLKPPGRTQWNRHAVDNVLYLSDTPGQSTAIDIIVAGGSTSAKPGWKLDDPRYSRSDWLAPADLTPFVLPAHSCRLGASLFWLLGGWRMYREQVVDHLHWIKYTLGADYIRAFFCCTGTKAWSIIGSNPSWFDFERIVREAQDFCHSIDLKIAWTLVGEGAGVPTLNDRLALVRRYSEIVSPDLIEFSEMWNEYEITGGSRDHIRQMADLLRRRDGWQQSRIALDTPMSAMSAPIGETPDALPAEVTAFYGGSAANVITPQFDRTLHDPRWLGPDAPAYRVLHEPRGLGSTVADISDPQVFAHDYVMGVVNGYRGYTFHAKPLVWGGHCHPDYPAQNDPPNIWDYHEADAVAAAVASVRLGTWPEIGDPTVPIPPYDEQWITQTVVPAFVDLYRRYNHPLDNLYPVWIARTEYDVDAGMAKDESLAKHLKECEDALKGA